MFCVSCGNEIEGEPVMAVYGDREFEHKQLEAFPLDRQCFERDRVLTVQRWVPGPDDDPVLEDFETVRYREVDV